MKVTLDGVTLGGLFDGVPHEDAYGVEWVLTGLNGWWGSPGTKARRTDRIVGPGAYRAASYKKTRVLEVAGVFTVPTQSGYLARRAARQLAAMCSDPADLYLLTVQDEVSVTGAFVELDGDLLTDLRDNLGYSMRFSVQLAAPDPRKFNLDWTSTTAPALVEAVGGIDAGQPGIVSTGAGILAGVSPIPMLASAYGQGTADNPQVLQVIGPVGNVDITNNAGTSIISYRGRLGAGESLYINLDSLPAYGVPGAEEPIVGHGALIGRTNARAAVAIRGGWPVLTPQSVANYLITGQLGVGSSLVVHSRGAWL